MFKLPPFDLSDPSFDEFRDVLVANGIRIVDDETDLGFIAFVYKDHYSGFTRNGHSFARVVLGFFDDTEFEDRSGFDSAFDRVSKEIQALNGPPRHNGHHRYPHRREGQHYSFCVWRLEHCWLALKQDEYDIQFGLDLTLQYIYSDADSVPVLYET